jgi:hypothetical protein
VYERLEAVVRHIERRQELDPSAIADVGTYMGAEVPRTRSEALPSEPA